MRKLPSIYKNTNATCKNKKVFYENKSLNEKTNKEINTSLESKVIIDDTSTILEKINTLFDNRIHTYTKLVEIKTKDKIYNTRLVFMKGNKLITIDNEEIKIDDIISVQY